MIFNVEETTLLRAFDTSTRCTAILSLMNEMGMMEDMDLIAQCMSLVKKLETVSDEDFAAVDFTVYDDENDESGSDAEQDFTSPDVTANAVGREKEAANE